MATSPPPKSADVCQRLLRGYQFSPSDQTIDDLSDLYTILDEHFAWFQAHLAALGFTLVRDGSIILLEKEQKELTGEEKQSVVVLFLLGDLWFEKGGSYQDLFSIPVAWADLDWFRDGYGREYLTQVDIGELDAIERLWRLLGRKGLVTYRPETRTVTLREPAARIFTMARRTHQRLRAGEEAIDA
jgi:hypothetical protein